MIMCSAVMASCYPELLDKGIYENYYLCAIDGYQTSIFALQELGEEMVKEKHIGLMVLALCTPGIIITLLLLSTIILLECWLS